MAISTEPRNRHTAARTYFPNDDSHDDIVNLARFFRQLESDPAADHKGAALQAPDGTVRHIPTEVFEVLEQVADALASGSGVTVAPNDMQMTTQQAADFLGISRPTLIKYLEDQTIPHEKRGRHRRVLLRDVIEFQEKFRVNRRSALRELARESQSLERQKSATEG